MKGVEAMPRVTNFNKSEYDVAYHKKHYKNISVVLKLDEAAALDKAVERAGVKRSAYIKSAILEKIEKESE